MNVPPTFRGLLAPALVAGGLMGLPAAAAHADWVQTSGPRGGTIRSLAAVPNGSGGTSLFAGQTHAWRSDDQGASWIHLAGGLTDPNAFAVVAVPNGSGGNDVFLGTGNGVFRSADFGASWMASSNGIPANLSIYTLASGPNGAGGTNLYAGGYLGAAYRSSNNGASWTAIQSGLPAGQANVNALTTTAAGTVLAGTMNGIYRSTNFGASWTRVFTLYGFSFARHGSTLYAGTSNGVYRSINDGATWTPINNGLGFAWIQSMAAIPDGSGVTLFAGAGGVLRSTDNGATWTSANLGLTAQVVHALATAPNPAGGTDLYAGTNEGIFRSTNRGNSWTNVSFIYSRVQALEASPSGAILAGTEADIFRSTNAGATWTDTNGSAVASALDFATNLHGTQGVSLFAGGSPTGVAKSTDDGATWFHSSNGLGDFDVNSVAAVPNGSGGTNLLAGTYSELYISTDDGNNWGPANLQTLTLDYAVTPNGIFAAGFGGVWRSTNGGTAWTAASGGIEGRIVQGIAATANGANLFAGGEFGVYRSTDDGATWSLANSGLTDPRINTLLSPDGTNVFAAGGGGVFVSQDHGISWTFVGTGLTTGLMSLAVSADGSTLIAGTSSFGVWTRPLSEMVGGAPPPPPPPPAPSIASFTPASGPVGTEVTITGSNFIGASAVRFNGTTAPGFTVLSATQIRSTVPAGASTGRISVSTAGGTATSSGDFTVTTATPPVTLTFLPPHDAWVRSSSPSSNFGSQRELTVRGGSQTIRSYLKFVVSGVVGTVQDARLRLRVTDAGPDGGSVFAASNNFAGSSTPWTEGALTWNNAPPLTGMWLDATGGVSVNTWLEYDVSAAVTGNGTFSFALTSASSNAAGFSSSEGADPPQLVVVASGGSAAAPAAIAIEGEATLVPAVMMLHANHPNPFRAETTIQYSLPRAASVRLVIYDVTGRAVRTLVQGVEEAGQRRATWDGRDERGSLAASGLYICRLEADGASLTRKVSLLR